MKRVLSFLLSFVMMFSVISAVDLSAYANEGSDYLSQSDINMFNELFLKTENEVVKGICGDVLTGKSSSWDDVITTVNQVERYWHIADNILPQKLTPESLKNDINYAFKFIAATLNILKNVDEIKNSDKNALMVTVDSMQIICSVFSFFGISTLYLTSALSLFEKVFIIADFIEKQNIYEAASLYEADLALAYYSDDKLPYYETHAIFNQEYAKNLFDSLYLKWSIIKLSEKFPKMNSESISDSNEEEAPKEINPGNGFASGKASDNITWELDKSTWTITFSGSGYMNNYNSNSSEYLPEWHSYPIKSIIVNNGIKSIGNYCFYDLEYLENITLTNDITIIGSEAFSGCKNLKTINLPTSLETISYHAFSGTGISYIYLPEKVSTIGKGSFSNIKMQCIAVSNTNPYFVSCDGVLYSKDKSDLYCYPANKIDTYYAIPKGTTKIISYAFEYSRHLQSIKFSENIDVISQRAFKSTQNLKSIFISKKLSKIEESAFVFSNITKTGLNVYYNGTKSEWNNIDITNPKMFDVFNGNRNFMTYSVIYCLDGIVNCKHLNDTFIGNIKAATCTEKGNCGDTICYDCREIITTGQEIAPLGHKYGVYTSNNDATYEKDGTKTAICSRCGEKDTVVDNGSMLIKTPELDNFLIKTVSLSLESSITMNFKVLKSAVADFENPYVVFNCEGDELTVTDYTEQGDYYVFSYPGISPQLMNDNVKAVLHATHNSIDYTSPEKVMSVRTYAYTMLDRYNSDDYAELRTLLVDLLNYGAASQKYIGYQTDKLVNADLTDNQKSWGTSTAPTFENIRNYDYKTIDNPTSKWVGSGLVLNNSVMVRAKFTADSIENKTVVITCGKGRFTYSKDDFVKDKDGNYYVYCNEIFANEMSEEILLTVYDNGVQCSNTMRFSIESYAKLVHDNYAGNALDELTTAMMRYGNSARAYGA